MSFEVKEHIGCECDKCMDLKEKLNSELAKLTMSPGETAVLFSPKGAQIRLETDEMIEGQEAELSEMQMFVLAFTEMAGSRPFRKMIIEALPLKRAVEAAKAEESTKH